MKLLIEESQVIARGMAEGDRKSYEKFVRIYEPMIFGECLHFCRDSIKAEDYVNEVLIRALISIGSFDVEKACMDTWVMCIARNYLKNTARDGLLEPELFFVDEYILDYNEAPVLKHLTGTEISFDDEEESPVITRLRRALCALSRRDRSILFYRAEGFSYESIGEFLRIKAGTAMTAYSRAVKVVRRLFSEDTAAV